MWLISYAMAPVLLSRPAGAQETSYCYTTKLAAGRGFISDSHGAAWEQEQFTWSDTWENNSS